MAPFEQHPAVEVWEALDESGSQSLRQALAHRIVHNGTGRFGDRTELAFLGDYADPGVGPPLSLRVARLERA